MNFSIFHHFSENSLLNLCLQMWRKGFFRNNRLHDFLVLKQFILFGNLQKVQNPAVTLIWIHLSKDCWVNQLEGIFREFASKFFDTEVDVSADADCSQELAPVVVENCITYYRDWRNCPFYSDSSPTYGFQNGRKMSWNNCDYFCHIGHEFRNSSAKVECWLLKLQKML
jgi:hypothetical protein